MNKNLLAVAVAGALAAPGVALAQASTTSVQIYGLFDVRVDQTRYRNTTGEGVTAGVPSTMNKTHMAQTAPNRIGFRGTEDLGGGMQAFFQVESLVTPDSTGANTGLGSRPTFVGLRGGWGEVSFGLQESPKWDVFKTTWQITPSQPHFGIIMHNGTSTGATPTPNCTNPTNGALPPACSELIGNGTAFRRTMADSVLYRSPVIAGFRFATMLTMGDMKEPSSATPAGASQHEPTFGAYSLTWSAGPLSLAAAYERHVGFRATNTAITDRAATDTGIELGARFNYGMGLIGVGWERLKYGNTGVQAGGATDNSFELKNWTAQATYNLTPSDVISAGYSKTPGRSSCGSALTVAATGVPTAASINQPGCGSATGAKMFSLSLDHSLSKRTALYAVVAKVDNNAAATYYFIDGTQTNASGGTATGVAAGTDSTNYQLGVKHTF